MPESLSGGGRSVAPAPFTQICTTPISSTGQLYVISGIVSVGTGGVSVDSANMQLVEVGGPIIVNLANPAPGAIPFGPVYFRSTVSGRFAILNLVAGTAAVQYGGSIYATPVSG